MFFVASNCPVQWELDESEICGVSAWPLTDCCCHVVTVAPRCKDDLVSLCVLIAAERSTCSQQPWFTPSSRGRESWPLWVTVDDRWRHVTLPQKVTLVSSALKVKWWPRCKCHTLWNPTPKMQKLKGPSTNFTHSVQFTHHHQYYAAWENSDITF